MLNRESKFPRASRITQIVSRSSDRKKSGRKRRGPFFSVLFILSLAAGLFIYELPGRPWEPHLIQLQEFVTKWAGEELPSIPSTTQKRVPVKKGPYVDRPNTATKKSPVVSAKPKQKMKDDSEPLPVQLDISIGMGFRPVGFKIAAVSHFLNFNNKPNRRIHRLPRFLSTDQLYGLFRLGDGQKYDFVLDLASSGFRMFVDRNQNGDLSDDGKPLLNESNGIFATRLSLPLNRVTGISQLKGDYSLWIYATPVLWKRKQMSYYSMTQMRGEIILKGKRYAVFLADSGPVDGDYRNDGINIDINGNGKIEGIYEFFPIGDTVYIDGVGYDFRITK